MNPFIYTRVSRPEEALAAGGGMYLAGGTELLNWMRLGIVAPGHIVDISRIAALERVEPTSDGLRIGALVKLNDAALHSSVMRDYPVLSQAILKAASAQLRNLATLGGNLMQRTRCAYFRSEDELPCNKRQPGSGCSALHGINDKHAILGWTDECVAVQPSDPAVALAALDATVIVRSQTAERRVPVRDFHTLPAQGAHTHNVLRSDELIVAIELGAPVRRSAYLKVRERESYEYAIVSAAVTLELEGQVIKAVRIALGSVAHKPWRLDDAEIRLVGLRVGSPEVRAVIDSEFASARPLAHNAHKVTLARNAVLRVLQTAAEAA
jgi:xanthine dehydrogenase YagS FAD-binding subunit